MTLSIRFELLKEARQHLFEAWRAAVELENFLAEMEQRSPRAIPPVTAEEVLSLAETYSGWVEKGATS
jgi:hypothetical protein